MKIFRKSVRNSENQILICFVDLLFKNLNLRTKNYITTSSVELCIQPHMSCCKTFGKTKIKINSEIAEKDESLYIGS